MNYICFAVIGFVVIYSSEAKIDDNCISADKNQRKARHNVDGSILDNTDNCVNVNAKGNRLRPLPPNMGGSTRPTVVPPRLPLNYTRPIIPFDDEPIRNEYLPPSPTRRPQLSTKTTRRLPPDSPTLRIPPPSSGGYSFNVPIIPFLKPPPLNTTRRPSPTVKYLPPSTTPRRPSPTTPRRLYPSTPRRIPAPGPIDPGYHYRKPSIPFVVHTPITTTRRPSTTTYRSLPLVKYLPPFSSPRLPPPSPLRQSTQTKQIINTYLTPTTTTPRPISRKPPPSHTPTTTTRKLIPTTTHRPYRPVEVKKTSNQYLSSPKPMGYSYPRPKVPFNLPNAIAA